MNKPKISEIFRLNKEQAQLDFVDIRPGRDTALYLDPYALTTREDEWSESAENLIVTFFEAVLDAVKNNNKKRGIELLSNLNEPEETHLGLSTAGNKGRGIGAIQAIDLYNAIKRSRAASSGLLEDLSDIALFIPGIGRDKISDITTNVVRSLLIAYTQKQCDLHNIPVRQASSGFYWDFHTLKWKQKYVDLPVYDSQKILLVPKHAVRYQVGVDHSTFRKMFVVEYLQEEHLQAGSSLVTVLRDKAGKVRDKVVYKKDVYPTVPTDKDYLASFSAAHPEILDRYRDRLKSSASKIPNINEENFQEAELANILKGELQSIPKGNDCAEDFHSYCIGALSFLFFPSLINPKKERSINQGRKRIDITYSNGKDSGFFYRLGIDPNLHVNTLYVECKNYTNEIANPEVDQLVGRFNDTAGRLGLLLFRDSDNLQRLKDRCADVNKQGNGVVLPIDDNFLIKCFDYIENGKRNLIDKEIDQLFQEVIS